MARRAFSVLVVDDEQAMREVLELRLEGWGYQVITAQSADAAAALVEQSAPDVVLCDVVMPGSSGIALLDKLKAGDRARPVIMMTAHGSIDDAVEAMKLGADDFLTKPIDPKHLHAVLDALKRRLGDQRAGCIVEATDSLEPGPGGMIGASESMQELFSFISRVAPNDADVLIHGESGTGKELIARAIHQLSRRSGGPFVAVNAAAIPETLVESHFFGHERGAFTGAERRRVGCFEEASQGSLFLDEITEMPLSLQPKLLRVLEQRSLRRIGGEGEVPVDVRVIAASNTDPQRAVDEGRLREDLFYRLNVFLLVAPPLRERKDDIPELVRHFIRQANGRHGTEVVGLTEAARVRLEEHHWPGNVRELRNAIERGVILAGQGLLEDTHLPRFVSPRARTANDGVVLPPNATVAEAERILILDTLRRVGNNKAEAARVLGIDVKTIRNKLKRYRDHGGIG